MVDWVLTNEGVLTFLELTNASRDVCIIYMLPVRVLEQKHRVRRRLTFKKTNIRRRRQMRWPLYKPSYKTTSVALCFQRKSNKALKKIWGSLCDLCIAVLHALQSVHTYILQHICHGFSSCQGNWFVQNALILGPILRHIDFKKSRDLYFSDIYFQQIF